MSYVRGKRERESVGRVTATPAVPSETRTPENHLESYVTIGRSEAPALNYVTIKVCGRPITALIDSGSNRTLFGEEGMRILREEGIETSKNSTTRIRTANGQIAAIRETARVLVQLSERSQEITVGLLANLAVPCIVGVDLLSAFGMILDFANKEWFFATTPHNRYDFSPDSTLHSCCGLSEITPVQEKRLENFLRTIPEPSNNLGVTSLTEHKVDVGSHPPIRQRCYVVSPKVQEAIDRKSVV